MATVMAGIAILLTLLTAPLAVAMGVGAAVALSLDGSVPLFVVVQRMYAGTDSLVLLALPFYILAGNLMESAGISDRLVALARVLVGHIRGSLGMVTLVAEYFFSGISGSTMADVSAIGAILIPAMRRVGYKADYAVSIVAAATAMGSLVPPSVAMIVLASIMEISVGALFLSGFVPAAVIALVIMALIYFQARSNGLPVDRRATCGQIVSATWGAWATLLMPIIIFVGIFGGVTSPTEAGAVACLYGLVAGLFILRTLRPRDLPAIFIKSALLSGAVMILVSTATLFTWILVTQQVPQRLGEFVFSVSRDPAVFLAISTVIFMFIGGLLEGIPAMVILVPVFYPLARSVGINSLHFAIVVYTAIQIGLFLPPFGIGILLSSSLGGISVEKAAPTFLPFLAALIVGLIVVAAFPWFTMVLPSVAGLAPGK